METKNPNKPNDFPILDFKVCPQCGGVRRVAYEVAKKQIEKGNLPKEANAFLYMHQSVIAGPVGTWLSAPVVSSFYDVCMDCGTAYCVHAEVVTAVQGGKIPKTGGGFSTS